MRGTRVSPNGILLSDKNILSYQTLPYKYWAACATNDVDTRLAGTCTTEEAEYTRIKPLRLNEERLGRCHFSTPITIYTLSHRGSGVHSAPMRRNLGSDTSSSKQKASTCGVLGFWKLLGVLICS